MSEATETVIFCAQQSFEIADGLNLVKIEIDGYRVLNIFKKF